MEKASPTQEKQSVRRLLSRLSGRRKLCLILLSGLLGILLLLFSRCGSEKSAKAETGENAEITAAAELSLYEKKLKKELETLCETADGVSDVTVTLSFSAGYTGHYLTDEKGAPICTGTGSSRTPVLLSVSPPAVSGVGIVCRGGDNPFVVKTLTELVSTALGISANRVFITGK